MSTDLSTLFDAYVRHRERGAPLVLATIVGTAGSTYRKAGARMLLEETGGNVGILGGGCFEGDLAVHAAEVMSGDEARVVEYDMRGDDDLIWGLGLGCNGLVRILLQPLTGAADYQPFEFLRHSTERHAHAVLATVVDGPAGIEAGRSLALDEHGVHGLGLAPEAWPEVLAECRARTRAGCATHDSDGGPVEIFYDLLRPVPHLLLLGGGPDAVPVAALARSLCWRVTVADHRPAWVSVDRFPAGCDVLEIEPAQIADRVDLTSVAAVVVMSHSFSADTDYLRGIAAAPPRYVGLLGPGARRDALLARLTEGDRRRLEDRARGPVGLDLGGRSPQAIALSLIAEIQATLAGRDGRPMDERYRGALRERAVG